VRASAAFPYDDSAIIGGCAGRACGSPTRLAALRRAVQPVLDALGRDPATAPSLAEVLTVAPAAAEPLDVPGSCRG